MFCKVTQDEKTVYVRPSWLGKILFKFSFGWIRPHIYFKRDFGPDCFDGRSLHVSGVADVTIDGNLMA
jgi:hypothetical protein